MFDSLPPGTGQSSSVAAVKVLINSTELNNETIPVSISVNKSCNKIAFAKLVFIDGSASDRDFTLSNDNNFKPGNTIEIKLGFDSQCDTVFKGIIVKHAIKIRQQGGACLMIEAKDNAIKLTGARKSAYYIDKTDSDIISDLAADLQKDIETTSYSHKQIVQFNATDWDFLVTRAEANSMLVFTDDGKLVARKPATTTPSSLTVTYGDNIYEFEAEMDARRQVSSVISKSWDYTQQQLESSESGQAVFSDAGNVSLSDLGNVLGAQVTLNHTGHLTQSQLQTWSDAYAMHNVVSKAIGRVRVIGNAGVKPGAMITLAGVGDRFNGDVFVTGVLHHFDGHWFTDIQFGWNEDWFYKKEDVIEKPASGLLPAVNGLLVGVVLDVNDSGDGAQYRIKVKIPTITSGNEGIWARVATIDAGDERGFYFRPQANDEVILGFLNDDPREPVVLGYMHSKDSKKIPFAENALQYGIMTKEGMQLMFDDTKKSVTLIAKVGEGQNKSIVLNTEGGGGIEIKDENQNTIKMDAQGITIQAGAGKVTISGTQVMIN